VEPEHPARIVERLAMTAGYAGSRGTHSPYMRDFNAPVYIPGQSTVANANERRPSPYFARFTARVRHNSSYNSFQASLSASAADSRFCLRTRSRKRSTISTGPHNNGAARAGQPRHEWAPASYDRTHAHKLSWLWAPPAAV
jgi:hypothetical protein